MIDKFGFDTTLHSANIFERSRVSGRYSVVFPFQDLPKEVIREVNDWTMTYRDTAMLNVSSLRDSITVSFSDTDEIVDNLIDQLRSEYKIEDLNAACADQKVSLYLTTLRNNLNIKYVNPISFRLLAVQLNYARLHAKAKYVKGLRLEREAKDARIADGITYNGKAGRRALSPQILGKLEE